MVNKKIHFNHDEEAFIEELKKHPQMFERFRAIMQLTNSSNGVISKADEVEELLIQEVRRLGVISMENWARGAEEQSARALKQSKTSVHCSKKKG